MTLLLILTLLLSPMAPEAPFYVYCEQGYNGGAICITGGTPIDSAS